MPPRIWLIINSSILCRQEYGLLLILQYYAAKNMAYYKYFNTMPPRIWLIINTSILCRQEYGLLLIVQYYAAKNMAYY